MSFFETTPMGRIVNIFSKDINVIDQKLPKSLESFIMALLSSMATIGVIAYSIPFFLIVFAPLIVVYGLTQVYVLTYYARIALIF